MYMLSDNNAVIDFDYSLLSNLLLTIEKEWVSIFESVKVSAEPIVDYLLDNAEYLAGISLVACQRYIVCTYPQSRISRSDAIDIPPKSSSGMAVARLINAGANYWKHAEERHWSEPTTLHEETKKIITAAGLDIETDYMCMDILDAITSASPNPFPKLSNALLEWRTNLIESRIKNIGGTG